jgi:hypothetical protein
MPEQDESSPVDERLRAEVVELERHTQADNQASPGGCNAIFCSSLNVAPPQLRKRLSKRAFARYPSAK